MVSIAGVRDRLPEQVRGPVERLYRAVKPGYYPYRSWSQAGEDVILRAYFAGLEGTSRQVDSGSYVDVGAYHPRYGSNTYLLHKRGWRGINIDARPGSMRPFQRERPEDVNLEIGVGTTTGSATFHTFREAELSTFDAELAAERARTHAVGPTVSVPIRTLADVLDEHLLEPPTVLSVDCEGLDLDVLRSNEWKRHRPRIVIVEASADLWSLAEDPVAIFLRGMGYQPFAATSHNLLFADDDWGRA